MNHLMLAVVVTVAASSIVAEERQIAARIAVRGFERIELSGSDSIVVVSGRTTSVVASGGASAVAALDIEVLNGTLRVGRRPGTSRDGDAVVTVTVPALRSAVISGSGDIRIGALSGRRFSGRVSGSGTLALADLRMGTADLDMSGSGAIVAQGRADAVAIGLRGSGRIDARGLATPAITVDLRGTGIVDASASRTAKIDANGSGQARIIGGARCDIRRNGPAAVRCG